MKQSIKPLIEEFLDQAKTSNLKTKHFPNEYSNLKVKVSFGQGGVARIPWISFLAEGQTTSDGIYPVFLYFKDLEILILAYGISETATPDLSWKLDNDVKMVKEFFEGSNAIPARYGSSYFFSHYDLKKKFNWSQMQKDIDEIIKIYKSIVYDKPVSLQKMESIMLELNAFRKDLTTAGLIINQNITNRFIISLLTKPFVILTGLSGSGKTKLAQAFTQWICQDESQYKITPVGADWANREPLLGYSNSLMDNNYVTPDNGALGLLIKAGDNEHLPYFLILDEMNLSHVERYFADFLSVMESGDKIKLYTGALRTSDEKPIPEEISWPKNLFIIGTVNIDETTYMFSPKVLDRANVIEFRITEEELGNFLQSDAKLDLSFLEGKGAGMGHDFVRFAKGNSYAIEDPAKLHGALLGFFKELKKTGAEFGYRSAAEITRFVGIASKLHAEWKMDDMIDAAIMQKLLPKLHGSRSKLVKVLTTLANLCLDDAKDIDVKKVLFDQYDKPGFAEGLDVKYPISLEKICRMHKNVIANGFTSYAEA